MRIQAHELRAGNWVQDTSGKKFRLSLKDFEPFYFYRPLPITEERLLNFRFDRKNTSFKIHGLTFYKNEDGTFDFILQLGRQRRVIELKYIHQMQNLIFTLAGKQLELKKEASL